MATLLERQIYRNTDGLGMTKNRPRLSSLDIAIEARALGGLSASAASRPGALRRSFD